MTARWEGTFVIAKLEYLLALARTRHFARAAETLGVAQPTLSAGIKQLEETLGVLLVRRGSRFQGFTPEGERVLDWARRIVGDVRAMREELTQLRRGSLSGHLRLAVVPTALAMVASLTAPLHARNPALRFTVLSRTSIEILAALENLDIDAGITYLDNEPLGRVRTVPLYIERYHLLVAASSPWATRGIGRRRGLTWEAVGKLPLCLLTPDMQNRRIIDSKLREAGVSETLPTLESDSIITLFSHVRTGQWVSVLPAMLVDTLGPSDELRAIPIAEPPTLHTIGLIVPMRETLTPLAAALITEALRWASPGQ